MWLFPVLSGVLIVLSIFMSNKKRGKTLSHGYFSHSMGFSFSL
ncbi:hypothetical protein J14TS5_58650 [Paenibacillus lautus]|nr:hypothetical protein J14TS5_58650 [Paenibacillus lautus]